MKTFDELVYASIDHAREAEEFLKNPGEIGSIDRDEAPAAAQIHATLAEAYARLASAMVVNATSLRVPVETGACPFGCRRHFANLERHVATKHGGQQLEAEGEA
jgi:hypothetical protein